MKTPDYLSYDRYKKKKDSNPNKRLFIFMTTFFATLLLFSVTAKNFSPDVDVTIGNDSEMEPKETGLGVKRFIDDRLKMIQMDDNTAAGDALKEKASRPINMQTQTQADKDFDLEMEVGEEKMKLPVKKGRNIIEEDSESAMPVYKASPRPAAKDLSKPYESSRISKVYVGRYSTLEQAKVAQEILMDSGLNVSPFVKDVGGAYTLQLGSYSSRAKADELSSELRRNNFPARVVQE